MKVNFICMGRSIYMGLCVCVFVCLLLYSDDDDDDDDDDDLLLLLLLY